MLLVVQEYCGKDPFNEFLNRIKEEKLLMSNDVIDVQKIKEIVTDYIIDSDKREFEETVDIIAGIKRIMLLEVCSSVLKRLEIKFAIHWNYTLRR